IPDLVRDALNLIGSEKCFSINDVNHELEELGWGIGIMDRETYGLITALIERNYPPDVEWYIHNRCQVIPTNNRLFKDDFANIIVS
ncbi:hypothetical protein ACFL6B_05755, partial [Thermodesulfobacteriota bacterium]